MPFDYDVLIAGAGPAGAAAAYDLAAAGARVLLMDKRNFPRQKACACGLTRKTLKALRYSVAPVIERECRDVVLQEAGPAFATGQRVADRSLNVRVRTREPFCAMAVRERFDAFCLQQTIARGAAFLKMESIVALHEYADHVSVEVTFGEGETRTLSAPILIGADGSNGQTRRLATGVHDSGDATAARLPSEPDWYARGFALEAMVPFADLPATLPAGDAPLDLVFDFAPISGGYGWLFPKGDHINIGVGGFVPQGSGTAAGSAGTVYESVTRKLLAHYAQMKLGVPLPANVVGQYLGLGGHVYVPDGRILLAGDAAGLVDPLTGEGIHSAVVSGQAAAAAVLASRTQSTKAVAELYVENLRPLQETLAFSHRAARSFYREPGRGFRVMRTPMLRGLVLKTYADGLPHTRLLASLAKRVA